MLLGYNTNGFAHHAPEDTLRVLAEIGYHAVALSIDHGVLNPRDARLGSQAGTLRRLARKHGLTLVVETGARFLLDPWTKHEPTLVSPDQDRRAARVAFLLQSIDIACELNAVAVSAWSGIVHDREGAAADNEAAWERLVSTLAEVLTYADRHGMPIAFEPEPGMLVDSLAAYRQLKERLSAAGAAVEALRLTVDVGHLHCLDETPLAEQIDRHAGEIANVHLEDMVRGVHQHLPFGEGEIDFPPVIAALERLPATTPVCVELNRQSHDAPNAARAAFDFLTELSSG